MHAKDNITLSLMKSIVKISKIRLYTTTTGVGQILSPNKLQSTYRSYQTKACRLDSRTYVHTCTHTRERTRTHIQTRPHCQPNLSNTN